MTNPVVKLPQRPGMVSAAPITTPPPVIMFISGTVPTHNADWSQAMIDLCNGVNRALGLTGHDGCRVDSFTVNRDACVFDLYLIEGGEALKVEMLRTALLEQKDEELANG